MRNCPNSTTRANRFTNPFLDSYSLQDWHITIQSTECRSCFGLLFFCTCEMVSPDHKRSIHGRCKMKSLLFLACLFLMSFAHGQGTVQFATRLTFGLPPYSSQVFTPEPGYEDIQRFGNTAANLPAGTQTYSGSPLTGSGWTAQLFSLPGNTIPGGPFTEYGTPTVDNFVAAFPTTTFRTGTSAGSVAPVLATLANVPPDAASAVLQLRVFPAIYGNWTAAVAAWDASFLIGGVWIGASPPFVVNNIGGPVNSTPPQLTGVSFSLVEQFIPEPSCAALMVLGVIFLCRSHFRK